MALVRRKIDRERLPEVVVAKWSEDVLLEGFVPFPKRFLRTMYRVLPPDNALEYLGVILAVADYLRPNLVRLPSLEYLAFIAGMSLDCFQRRLAELERANLVVRRGTDDALEVSLQPLLAAVERETIED